MFGHISALEATVKWGIGILERWVQKLCEEGRILGVAKFRCCKIQPYVADSERRPKTD